MTLRRPFVLSATLVAACAATVVVSAPTAQAAVGCTARADLPARVAIAHDSQTVRSTLVVTCNGLQSATFLIFGPSGQEPEYYSYSRPTYDNTWTYTSFLSKPGTYQTRAGFASGDGGDWSVATDTAVVKYASYDAMSVRRTGSTSVFTASVSHYDPFSVRASERSNSINVLVTFQQLVGGTWVTKQQVRTGSSGQASLTVVDPARRTYRTVVADAGTAFGVTSGAVGS